MSWIEQFKFLKKSIKKRMLSYIGAGIGLVVGLAWNDAIRSLISFLFPTSEGTIVAKFVYALILTLILGVLLTYLEKALNEEKDA